MNPFNKIKTKLLAIEATPGKVSRGYALGVFLGTTPFIGTKVFIALILTSLFRWSRLASVVGVYHINILTAPLFYGMAYGTGQWITDAKTVLIMPGRLTFDWLLTTFFGSWEVLQALLVGGLVLGIPMSAIAYFLSYALLRKARWKPGQIRKSRSCDFNLHNPDEGSQPSILEISDQNYQYGRFVVNN